MGCLHTFFLRKPKFPPIMHGPYKRVHYFFPEGCDFGPRGQLNEVFPVSWFIPTGWKMSSGLGPGLKRWISTQIDAGTDRLPGEGKGVFGDPFWAGNRFAINFAGCAKYVEKRSFFDGGIFWPEGVHNDGQPGNRS
jgi:hypothetical protein